MKVVCIFGPTAVGKTEVAIELAELLRDRGEGPVAVSCDALQVYRGLDTITSKPDASQLKRLEHRLISFVPVERKFNAYLYAESAHSEIDLLLKQGRRPVVVGGTGLYLRAAIAEMKMKPAVEGEPSELWSEETRRPTKVLGLFLERNQLYRAIDSRVEQMIASGAREEVKALSGRASATARKAIGFDLLAGDLPLDEVSAMMKKETRKYAKRQLTWMRKVPDIEVVDRTGKSAREAAQEILVHM